MISEIEVLKRDIRIVNRAKKNSPAKLTLVIPDKMAEQILSAVLENKIFMSMKISVETEITE